LATQVLEQETLAQQSAGIVRHAVQLVFHGLLGLCQGRR
jgi:hypothetical protein